MNNFRKTTWKDAKGQDVWIKLADGTMEKLTWTGRFWVDGMGYSWTPDGPMLRLTTPYLQTTEAVEITFPEAVERAMKGHLVVDENGTRYHWTNTVRWHIERNLRYFIPAIDETVEVTVTLPAASKEDFVKGVSAFAGAKVKE